MGIHRHDGYTRQLCKADLVDGNVIRVFDDEEENSLLNQSRPQSPFSDCLIVGVDGINREDPKLTPAEYENGVVKLARPYAFVQHGTILQGFESFSVSLKRLLDPDSRYCLVIQSTGKAANHLLK